jgi:hypothetical protein
MIQRPACLVSERPDSGRGSQIPDAFRVTLKAGSGFDLPPAIIAGQAGGSTAMADEVRCYTLIAAACIALPACSNMLHTRMDLQAPDEPMQAVPEPATDPSLDHFVARVPLRLADTAIQARAMAHVAIGRARAQAGSGECGRTWLVSGPVSGSSGPVLTGTAEPVWYYRVSRQPGNSGCGEAGRDERYETLEGSLPGWITLRRARTTAADTGLVTSASR